MPLWDYKCVECGAMQTELFHTARERDEREDALRCEDCGGGLSRRPAAPAFSVFGYSARNGYSTGGVIGKVKNDL